MYRMAWPAQALIDAGHDDIVCTFPDQRWQVGAKVNRANEVVDVVVPDDASVIVIQRPAHKHLVDCISHWQKRGVRVICDVDDNLHRISPNNPAFEGLRPKADSLQSWNNLARACQIADAVTVTTPALALQYRAGAVVLPNFLPSSAFRDDRVDSTEICWPASLPTHPEDAGELGATLERVVRDTGAKVRLLGDGPLAEPLLMRAFGLSEPPIMQPYVPIEEYAAFVASIGIGVAPLVETKFNEAKSAVKILEMMAAGVPFVASPRADYLRVHQESGAGLMARRSGDWYRHLTALVRSESLRTEQSEMGRAAAERYRISDHAEKWYSVWRG